MDTLRLGRAALATADALALPNHQTAAEPACDHQTWRTLGSARRRWAMRLSFLTAVAAFVLLLVQTVDGAQTDRHARSAAAEVALASRVVLNEILLYGNLDLADDVVAPNAFVQTPDGVWHGSDGLRTIASMLHAAVADLRLGIEAVETNDHIILIHWVMSGTIRESILGFDPTNVPVLVTGTLTVHVSNGLVYDVVLATTSQAQPLANIDT